MLCKILLQNTTGNRKLCCHIDLAQSKFYFPFCNSVCTDRQGVLPGTSKPACNEKKRPREPFRLVNIIADMETKEMRTRESARLEMPVDFMTFFSCHGAPSSACTS